MHPFSNYIGLNPSFDLQNNPIVPMTALDAFWLLSNELKSHAFPTKALKANES